MPVFALTLFLLGIPSAAAAQAIEPEMAALARIRAKAAASLRKLPDYVCIQTIERARRPRSSSEFQLLDKTVIEVAHVGGKELYSRLGNRELSEGALRGMQPTGMVATGSFGAYANSLFVGNAAVFTYRGVEVAGTRRVLRFDYRISALQSALLLSDGGREETVAEKGSFWANETTEDLARIRSEADEIPFHLGIASASMDIEYARFAKAGNLLLPVRAEARLQHTTGNESRNVSTFAGCRHYSAESAVSFDVPDEPQPVSPLAVPVPPSRVPPAPAPTSMSLPAGLILALELETPIDSQRMKRGDEIRARLTADAVAADGAVVPAGAVARGWLRVFERTRTPNAVWVVIAEFTEIESDRTRFRLVATLESFEEGRTIRRVQRFIDPPGNTGIPGALGFPGLEEVVIAPEVQSGGAFLVRGSRARVPRGFRMTFRTR